ncbi:MAG TPA: hypothetical protein VFI24_06050 [Pyrinomonadaceae bacterium]|nr:hypothetical protein [Pyrinomonadaceae bacterium]
MSEDPNAPALAYYKVGASAMQAGDNSTAIRNEHLKGTSIRTYDLLIDAATSLPH